MPAYKEKSVTLVHGVLSLEAVKALKLKGAIFICEGRPSMEAGKSNSAAFAKAQTKCTVICDNMAGFLFYKGWVKELILACQYADQGGALCEIGCLIYAVLAKRHDVPIRLVQAKERTRFLGNPHDICQFENTNIAPKGTKGYVPLVEWVPSKYLK